MEFRKSDAVWFGLFAIVLSLVRLCPEPAVTTWQSMVRHISTFGLVLLFIFMWNTIREYRRELRVLKNRYPEPDVIQVDRMSR